MWNRASKQLLMAFAGLGLLAPALVTGQDQPAAQAGPKYKDQGEYTLYDSILKDTNPKTKLDRLQEWQTKYPSTEFDKPRKALFLDTYIKLNQPKEAVGPANVTRDQWKGARPGVEILGHSTLGWIAMQRKTWDAAETEFQKTLHLDPN